MPDKYNQEEESINLFGLSITISSINSLSFNQANSSSISSVVLKCWNGMCPPSARFVSVEKAHSMYGNPLPRNIEERIAQEFYGDKINELVIEKIRLDHPEMNEEEVVDNLQHKVFLHYC